MQRYWPRTFYGPDHVGSPQAPNCLDASQVEMSTSLRLDRLVFREKTSVLKGSRPSLQRGSNQPTPDYRKGDTIWSYFPVIDNVGALIFLACSRTSTARSTLIFCSIRGQSLIATKLWMIPSMVFWSNAERNSRLRPLTRSSFPRAILSVRAKCNQRSNCNLIRGLPP